MSYTYGDTLTDCETNIAKYTKVLPAQRSPTDLQNFYENFDPDSNDDCLFGYSSPKDEEIKCDESINNNDYYTSPITFYQTPSQCQPHFEYYSCNTQNPLNSQALRADHPTKACTYREQIQKTITKKKRKRTTFTTEQIIAMEQIFKTRPYICREERLMLTQKLQVSEKSIKVWFQNRRRISEKRENVYLADSPSSVDTCDSNSDRLAYIESQINERVDKYGNVALDECVLTELVNIIDEYLPKETEALIQPKHVIDVSNTYLSESNDSVKSLMFEKKCNNYTMYEPISPASVLDEFLI